MLRLLLPFAALLASGCFVDSVGLLPSVGGAEAGAADTGGAGGEPVTNGAGGAQGGAAGGAQGGAPPGPQHCPPGEVVADIEEGVIDCEPITADAIRVLADNCAVFYGWRDNCNAGCSDPPSRFGKVTSEACTPPGGNSTCQTQDLASDAGIELLGLDLDGGVDDGDRLYAAINCQIGSTTAGPCGTGSFVTGYDGRNAICRPLSGAVLDYVRPRCGIVTGWRDQCTDCTTEPTKYASSTSLACDPGMFGACAETVLGEDTVQMHSFDLDGAVGEDDKFYVGMHCEDVSSPEAPASNNCASGEVVVGLEADGALICRGVAEAAMTVFREHCALFYGWRDGCDNCTTIPAKWGRVKDGACDLGVGNDDTCSTMTLGGQTVSLFGLNTDGTLNDNDKLYIGFRCE